MLDTYNASKNNIGREMLSRISSKEDSLKCQSVTCKIVTLSSSKRISQSLEGAILTCPGTITSLAPAANAINICTIEGSKV